MVLACKLLVQYFMLLILNTYRYKIISQLISNQYGEKSHKFEKEKSHIDMPKIFLMIFEINPLDGAVVDRKSPLSKILKKNIGTVFYFSVIFTGIGEVGNTDKNVRIRINKFFPWN